MYASFPCNTFVFHHKWPKWDEKVRLVIKMLDRIWNPMKSVGSHDYIEYTIGLLGNLTGYL